jgi:hypothetical protein
MIQHCSQQLAMQRFLTRKEKHKIRHSCRKLSAGSRSRLQRRSAWASRKATSRVADSLQQGSKSFAVYRIVGGKRCKYIPAQLWIQARQRDTPIMFFVISQWHHCKDGSQRNEHWQHNVLLRVCNPRVMEPSSLKMEVNSSCPHQGPYQ